MFLLQKSNFNPSLIFNLILFASTALLMTELMRHYVSKYMHWQCSDTDYRCDDGSCIGAFDTCNGVRDCPDGSDEAPALCGAVYTNENTLEACELPQYPAQGSYVVVGDPGARPGGRAQEAVLEVSCDPGYEISGPKRVVCREGVWYRPMPDCIPKYCVLPSYPEHGTYSVDGVADATPGLALPGAALSVKCAPGYGLLSHEETICFHGIWSGNVTSCVRLCRLEEDPSVKYRCLHIDHFGRRTYRSCNRDEFDGTIVKPHCRKNYVFQRHLKSMRCINGKWNYIARCQETASMEGEHIAPAKTLGNDTNDLPIRGKRLTKTVRLRRWAIPILSAGRG